MATGYRTQRVALTPSAASVQQDVALQIDAGLLHGTRLCAVVRLPGDLRREQRGLDRQRDGVVGVGEADERAGRGALGDAGVGDEPGGELRRQRERRPHLAGDRPDRVRRAETGVDVVAVAEQLPTTSARVDVSADYGTTWATVYGPTGGQRRSAWAEKLDRAERGLCGAGIPGRFRFESGPWGTAPGWYIDDVGVTTLRVNPTAVYAEPFDASSGGYASGGTNSSWAWVAHHRPRQRSLGHEGVGDQPGG